MDNCFNVPLEHAKELCNALMEAEVKVRWNTCLAPYACDAELIGLMKEAGCGLVMMGRHPGRRPSRGGQTTPPATHRSKRRPTCARPATCTTPSRSSSGKPGETRESVENKLEFLRGLKPSLANLRVGVSVMPGTEVATLCIEEGIIGDESELIAPTFYMAEEVRPWLVDYLREQVDANPAVEFDVGRWGSNRKRKGSVAI